MMNTKSTIEWETARSKKSFKGKRFDGNSSSEPKTAIADINENYVPKGIREELDNILYDKTGKSLSTFEKNKLINAAIKNFSSSPIWKKKLNIYVIHKACKLNNYELVSSIIENEVKKTGIDYTVYTNAVSSTKSGNTILLDATFYGSRACMNYLIINGADLKHINKDGEDIFTVLEKGRTYKKEKFPDLNEAVDSNFDDCVDLIKAAEERIISSGAEVKATEVKATEVAVEDGGEEGKVKACGGAGGAGCSAKEASEKSKFRPDYTFETLTEDVNMYLEDQSTFRELVIFLKKDKDLTELLIKVLDDEIMQDNLIEYPYALKLI